VGTSGEQVTRVSPRAVGLLPADGHKHGPEARGAENLRSLWAFVGPMLSLSNYWLPTAAHFARAGG